MVKARERKSNLPKDVATLGPFYLHTDTKNKFRDACTEKKVNMESEVKGKVLESIHEIFPGWVPPE